MISVIIKSLEYLLIISIAVLTYVVFMRFQELQANKKFIVNSLLPNHSKGKNSTWANNKFLSHYHQELEKKFEEAEWKESPVVFTIKRVVLAFLFILVPITLYIITKLQMYLLFAPFLGYIAYQMPKRKLRQAIGAKTQNLKQELPEYLSSFAILLQSYTPYEATKKSLDYTGPLLHPYVERLITEIDLNPASQQPYLDFAKTINIPEAKEFMVALNKSMTVNAIKANKIIQDQIKLSDELQEEGYNELIEKQPDLVQKWERSLVFCMLAIILVFTFLQMFSAFKGI